MALFVLSGASNARGQDSDEVKRLKEKIELLEAKLEAAKLKMEKLETENKQLQADAKKPADKLTVEDPFTKGTIFVGFRNFVGFDAKQQVRLEITSRNKTSFEGQLTITDGGSREVKVTGTAPIGKEGTIKFKTEKSGKFQQNFTGKYGNGEIGFDFGGSGYVGEPVMGKGVIKVQ
ncbi:hypothetical protein FRUB_06050 [Fimbriiglobus ruber]|uniref:Uncharacterized protein n=1 Tax=Fimbriiglobus ruber TaxID=1908690 RepID=A0A225DTN9_9BACT|nr:hypothetical protein FRUB_06050 [Fimbriiglobus ruber]